MIASASSAGPAWVWLVGVGVFVAVLVVLTVDRVRLTRRCSAREREAALLRTDLADARREIDALRDSVRERARNSGARGARDASDPTTSVG